LIGESCLDKGTEDDSNDITECSRDYKPTLGTLEFSDVSGVVVADEFVSVCVLLIIVDNCN